MRLTSSRLDQPSLASKEFIMKQKGFDIIRINKDLLYLPGVLCKLSVQCFKYNYVVMLINVRRVFCFYSFGCGEPVHEPVRCAVSNQNHVVFLCLWVYILPILWAAYADQCLYLSNYAVENFFFKSWLPELKREVYPVISVLKSETDN